MGKSETKMKHLIFLFLFPAFSYAGPYYEVVNSTTAGTSTMTISGYIGVAASSTTPTTYKFRIDGPGGYIQYPDSTKQTTGAVGVLAATQTFTGVNTFNNKIEIAKTYTESISSETITGAHDISFSSSTFYWVALNASTTFTFSNVVANSNVTFMIEQSSNTKLVTWPDYVDWGVAGTVLLSTTTRKVDMVNVLCLSATKCYGKGNRDGYNAP